MNLIFARYRILFLIYIVSFTSMSGHAGTPLWTFTPLTATNIAITADTTAQIQYIITNQSRKTHTLVMSPIAGIDQISTPGFCANTFVLKFQESCTLSLQVTGSRLQDNVFSGPKVCEHGNPLQCYQPSQVNSLNITRSAGTFLALADVHFNQAVAGITYGQDTGTTLWTSTQNELTQMLSDQKPEFMIYLGDSPAHTQTNKASNIQMVLQTLSSGLIPVPLFYVYGNNDSYNTSPDPTVDYGPFSLNGVNLFSLDPAYSWPALNVATCPSSTSCINLNTSSDVYNAQTYGFYTAYPLGSTTPFRLIALNSVIFSHDYAVSPSQRQFDAQLEMDWLAAQLKDAQIKNEQVYIAMHIPVGNDAFNPQHPDMWNTSIVLNGQVTPVLAGLSLRNAFLRLISIYKNNVRHVVNGHTHMEEYRVLYDGFREQPLLLEVGVPGITPLFDNNPGMQVYFYDTEFQLIDAITYYSTPAALSWLTFSFRSNYACPPHTTMFSCVLKQLIPYLSLESSAAVAQYKANYPVLSPAFSPTPLTTWETILNTIQVYPTA